MATTYIQYAKGGSDFRTKGTISCWVKRSRLSTANEDIWSWGENNSSDAYLRFDSADNVEMHCDGAGGTFNTTTLHRDINGWYHFVFSLDGSNSTANLRRRFWINGVQIDEGQGSLGTFSAAVMGWHSTQDLWIGARARSQQSGSAEYFDGLMSHFHYCSNHSYAASDFGSFDSTTGEWRINTNPNVNYGSEGFFLKMEDSSNMDLDSSGNNKTLTTSGTLTATKDNPSNVFATFNRLYNSGGTVSYSAGNTRFAEADNQWKTTFSTLGASAGKYYAEFKCNGNYMMVGVADYNVTKSGIADRNFSSTTYISEQGYGIYNGNGDLYYRGSSTSYAATYGSGDIIGVALDCDNNKVFFAKNGVWQNSADPTSAGTGFSMTATDATYVFAIAVQQDECHANFGNGYFNTTAVSSAGTNASNLGIFEYDVPTGYTALCTKGLNE
tara:strand:+ start:255 stop:1577 length:1323 start_codon:yes stop_codon:yes gene_type:complete